jgi:hypothetical protein
MAHKKVSATQNNQKKIHEKKRGDTIKEIIEK